MGKSGTEIRTHIGIAKDAFRKLNKVIRDKNCSSETTKRTLNCYVTSILLSRNECWTTSRQEETGGSRYVVLQKDLENSMEEAIKQREGLKENDNRKKIYARNL